MADRNLELALRITAKDTGAAKAVQGIQKDVDGLTTKLRQLAAVAGTAFGAREVLQAAEQYSTLTARIRLATTSQEQFNLAQGELFRISQATRAPLDGAVTLYARTAEQLRQVAASEREVLGFIETVNQSLAVSGSTGQEAASFLLQFAQALGKGVLNGDEFRAVSESNLRLLKALADGLDVPIGKLKEMGEEGTLTTDLIFKALSSQKDKIAREFSELPETVSGALQRIRNAFIRYTGEVDSQTGTSRALAQVLTDVANNFDTLGDAAIVAGGIIASVYTGRVATALAAHGKAMASTATQAVAARQAALSLAVAEQTAAAAALSQARAQEAAAAAALAEANAHRSNVAELGIYGATRAAAGRQVTAAAAAHLAATNAMVAADVRLAAAGTAVAAAQSKTALASRGLAAAVGFLGGPIGVVTTLLTAGALAWYVWGDRAESAAQKAKRATQEVADQANAILDRMKKMDTFGSGDLGILRERASLLEKEISLSARSSGQSPGAANQLKQKRAALEEVRQAIVELEAKETEQANQFSNLAIGQAADAKTMRESFAKGIKDQIQGYQKLAQAARTAWEDSLQAQKDYLAQAAALEAEVAGNRTDDSPESKIMARRDLAFAQDKLVTLKYTGTPEQVREQSQLVQGLARSLEDQAAAQRAVNEAKSVEAGAYRIAARGEGESQAGLLEQENRALAMVKDLQIALDAIGKGTPVKLETEEAKIALAELTKQLDQIKDKTITVRVVRLDESSGRPLDNLSQGVKGFATGGLLQGAGHATSDNILLLGSPGEYMLKAAAVKHYGLPIIEAINSLRLPRFAAGGLIDRLPSMPRSTATPAAPSSLGTVNVNIDLGQMGRFPMQAAPDVAGGFASALRSSALQVGGRGR